MMRTEEDLRAALATRERLAPAPDAVLRGVRRRAARRRRTRTVGVLAAATLAVAAAAMVPALVLRPDPAASPATGSPVDAHAADRPDFSFTIAAGHVAGFVLRPEAVNAQAQTVAIRPVDGDRLIATLVLYRPGQGLAGAEHSDGWGEAVRFPDPAQEPNARVHDGPAWFDVDTRWSGLTWRYAPDAYAGLETNAGPLPRETLITIAEAVRFVDPYPARLPYRLDHLPADFAPVHVTQHHPRYYSHVRLLSWERIRDTWREGLPDITVTDDPPDPGADWDEYWYADLWRGERQPTTIAGRPARCSETRCDIDYGDYLVSVGVVGWSRAEIEQVVAGLQLADPADPATWFAIDDAIPGL